MRITNMMTSQKMYNDITKNRTRVDKYYTQMSTGKSIMYPSEDPIRASRALKFRTNVSQAEQYSRNVTQGYSWMEISEIAIANVEELTERIRNLATQGATDSYDADDRTAIATEITSIIEELGMQMNQTYGGRNVFTGYRTDVPAVFTGSSSNVYDIKQDFSYLDIEGFRAYSKTALDDVATIVDGYRLKLPYNHIETGSINFAQKVEFGVGNNSITTIKNVVEDAANPGIYEIRFSDNVPLSTFNMPGSINIGGESYNITSLPADADPDNDGIIDFIKIDATGKAAAPEKDAVVTRQLAPTGNTVVYDAASTGFKISSNYTFIENAKIDGKDTFVGKITIDGKQYAIEDHSLATAPYDQTKVYYNKASDTYYLPSALTEKYKDAATLPISVGINEYLTATQPAPADKIAVNDVTSKTVDAYSPAPWQVNYISDTGEIILSKEAKEYLTSLERSGFAIEYTKGNYEKGEINPLVYFDCMDKTANSIDQYKVYDMKNQSIEYEFSTNIRIGVNNLAKDMFTANMYSELKDFCTSLNNAQVSNRVDLELYYGSAPFNLKGADLTKKVDGHISEETQKSREALQKRFETLIGNISGFASTISKQRADLGTRMSRLELLGNRLEDDIMSYTKLLSENEDADLMEATMNWKTCDSIYQASLSVSAKLLQTSLVDFLR